MVREIEGIKMNWQTKDRVTKKSGAKKKRNHAKKDGKKKGTVRKIKERITQEKMSTKAKEGEGERAIER